MTSGTPTSDVYSHGELGRVGSLGLGMGHQARSRGVVLFAKDEISGVDSLYQNYLSFGDDDLVDSRHLVSPMHVGLSDLYSAVGGALDPIAKDELSGADSLYQNYLLFSDDELVNSLTGVPPMHGVLSDLHSAFGGAPDPMMVRRHHPLTGGPPDLDVAQALRGTIVSREMGKGEPIRIWLGSLGKGWGANPFEHPASPSCSRALRQPGGKSGQLSPEAAARLRDIFTLADEDPDEPSVSPASVRNLVAFLVDNPTLPHPSIGLDPNGYVDAEWSLPDGTLVVMVFLPDDQVRCAAVGSVDVSGTLPRQDVLALLEPLPFTTA